MSFYCAKHNTIRLLRGESCQLCLTSKRANGLQDMWEELQEKEEGVKHDQDKPHLNLVLQEVPNALVEVSKALRLGELKYGRENWKRVHSLEDRYLAAMLRHLIALHQGEEKDAESGLSHLAHVAVNALFLLDYEVRGEKENS